MKILILGMVIAVGIQTYGSPHAPRNYHTEPLYQSDVYLQDTPEVIAAREAHLAAVENVKKIIHGSHTTPNIQAFIKTPENVDEHIVATTPVPGRNSFKEFIIRLPEKDNPIVVERFSNDDKKNTHTTNEKLIVLQLNSIESGPAILKIYLPYIIHNNNPYYKLEEIYQNTDNLEAEIVSNYPQETRAAESNKDKLNIKVSSDEHVEKFVDDLYNRQNFTNIVQPVVDKESNQDSHPRIEEHFDNANIFTVPGVHGVKEVQDYISVADREVEKFVLWLERKYFGTVHQQHSTSDLENKSHRKGDHKFVKDAEINLDNFVSQLNNIDNSYTKDIQQNSEVKENNDANNKNSSYSVDAVKAINKIELEKFLARLEEKYRNGTRFATQNDTIKNIEIGTIIFKNDKPNDSGITLLFDERFGETNKEKNLQLQKSDINFGKFRSDSNSVPKSLNDTDLKTAERFIGDILKIVDSQVVKFVDELLSKHDAETLENAAKELILSGKSGRISKIIGGLVKKIGDENTKSEMKTGDENMKSEMNSPETVHQS